MKPTRSRRRVKRTEVRVRFWTLLSLQYSSQDVTIANNVIGGHDHAELV